MNKNDSQSIVEESISGDGTRKVGLLVDPERSLRAEAALFEFPGQSYTHGSCISTQLGCAVGCVFCASASKGYYRNLTSNEIFKLTQELFKDIPQTEHSKTKVSFMGVGEPLANRTHLLDAIEKMIKRWPRLNTFAVSTVGPASRIDAFRRDIVRRGLPIKVNLQLSLHATDDDTRRMVLPHAGGKISDLLGAGKRYRHETGAYVCLNYLLLNSLNDRLDDLHWLLENVDKTVFLVKFPDLSEVPGIPHWVKPSSNEKRDMFWKSLKSAGLKCDKFTGRGSDIDANCGQMAILKNEVAS
jgi:23S rRNA (adenine2503-C2)-methyltransferase